MAAGRKGFVPIGFKAFTVLELLMAMALFTILGVIAIPNWLALLPYYRLNSATRQVQSELHKTKSRAISERASYRVVLSPASYSIEKDDGSGWQSTGENKPLPEGISLGAGSALIVSFTSRGTSGGGTAILCNAVGKGKTLIVSGAGRIRIDNANC
jgi:type II secretory pathway pseudopilin PulG